MEGLIGLLFFLIALYLAYLLILLIVGLFLDIIKGIWDFIVGIVTEVWNFFTDPIVLIPMIILTIIVVALNIKQRKKWIKRKMTGIAENFKRITRGKKEQENEEKENGLSSNDVKRNENEKDRRNTS